MVTVKKHNICTPFVCSSASLSQVNLFLYFPTEPWSLVCNKLWSPVSDSSGFCSIFFSGNRHQMEYYWDLISGFTLSLVWPRVDLYKYSTSISSNPPWVDFYWTLIQGIRIRRDFCWSPVVYKLTFHFQHKQMLEINVVLLFRFPFQHTVRDT